MIRLLTALLMIALIPPAMTGQTAPAAKPENAADARQSTAQLTGKQLLLHQIELYETAARSAEDSPTDRKTLVRIYTVLGNLYLDGGMYLKAEDAMRRAILLLKDGPQDELAEEYSQLSMLHGAMGKLRETEKDQKQELRIREAAGDPVGIALAWDDMAALYYAQRKFKNAVDYARKAYAVLANRPGVSVDTRIAVRQALAFALSGVHNYQQSIPILEDALALSRSVYGEDSLHTGVEAFMLGYTYWQSGDKPNAAVWMGRGIARMKVDLGWGHSIYLNSMGQYARFLRQNGEVEEAASAESELRRAQDDVDARAFTGMSSALLSPITK
jgi:tetratricopeptide (TPR) repeat protein